MEAYLRPNGARRRRERTLRESNYMLPLLEIFYLAAQHRGDVLQAHAWDRDCSQRAPAWWAFEATRGAAGTPERTQTILGLSEQDLAGRSALGRAWQPSAPAPSDPSAALIMML